MRLYRPYQPLELRCRVAMRQLGELWPSDVIRGWEGGLGKLLDMLLSKLAETLGCTVEELRLDHDPPLGARPRHRHGLGRKTYYIPDANDPEHLFYRPHGAQHAGSHLIKTNVRGDHGQHPDRVLIKKQRRLEKQGKSSPKTTRNRRQTTLKSASRKWPKRKLRSANRWPARTK